MRSSLDSFNARAIVLELQGLVVEARLQKISQLSEEDFLLHLRSAGRTDKLLISLHHERARLHLMGDSHPPAIVPSSFLMLCRKHIGGTRLLSLEQRGMDRAVELQFHSGFSLVFDWAGAPPTLLLIKTEERTCVGRFPPSPRFQMRRPYEPPEPAVPSVLELEAEAAVEQVQALQGLPLAELLAEISFGWSPLWTRRFAHCLPSGALDAEAFRQTWSTFFDPLKGKVPLRPGVDPDGKLSYCLTEGGRPTESMQAAAQTLWAESTRAPGIPDFRSELLRILKKGRDKSLRKVEKRKKDRKGAETAPQDQMYGDLLLAYASSIEGKPAQFRTQDWEGRQVTIPLDPMLTPTENAEKFYTRGKKKKRALQVLDGQIALAEEEVAFWDELLFAAERAETRTDLEEIRKSVPGPRQRKGRKTPEIPTSGPRRFEHQGFQLLVGRNPAQNEKLSLRMGAKDDHWFHIRQGAGSHVLLRTAGREPSSETILAGAWLAARYSRASESSTAEVVTTRIRYLKKPKGGPLGKVIYRQEQELTVDPTTPPPEGLKEADKKEVGQ